MGLQPPIAATLPNASPLDLLPSSIGLKRKLDDEEDNSACNNMDEVNSDDSGVAAEDDEDHLGGPSQRKKARMQDVASDNDDDDNDNDDDEDEDAIKTILRKEESDEGSPKVIVEHQPLPSIYELQENSQTNCDDLDEQYDSGLSGEDASSVEDDGHEDDEDDDDDEEGEEEDEDEDDEEEVEEDDEDDDDESQVPPIYSSVLRSEKSSSSSVTTPVLTPPKALYSDRFWSQTSNSFGSPPTNSSTSAANPPNPQSPKETTFQFLEQSTQRIECAENGKSYLQLGTMSHHLPVTPVIQPKPNMVYRRPPQPMTPPNNSQPQQQPQQPPLPQHQFRSNLIPHPSQALSSAAALRPVCDHSNCLQRKASHCYKTQRARMLNVSLQKLHLARQNHEGCLRRSVLICNMLRYIEDETERDAAMQYAPITSPPHPMEIDPYWGPPPPPPQVHQQQQQPTTVPVQQQQQQQSTSTMTPSQYHLTTGAPPPPPPPQTLPSLPTTSSATSSAPSTPPTSTSNVSSNNNNNSSNSTNTAYSDSFETTLKDFNSAFRSTPFSSPTHSKEEDESERGSINWGSVLSLSSNPAEESLDPLNNNNFSSESSWTTSNNSTTVVSTTSGSSTTSTSSTTSPTSSPSIIPPAVDDIGWKLSADDVLRAFPNDENLFVGP